MHWMFAATLLAGAAANETSTTTKAHVYDNYTRGYHAARAVQRPMLVILNPGAAAESGPVTAEALEQTSQRRNLLQNYVVVIVDTETAHGQAVRNLFGSQPLPHVAVIDKRQERQLYRTSQPLQGQHWTWILETFRTGEQLPPQPAVSPFTCFT